MAKTSENLQNLLQLSSRELLNKNNNEINKELE